MPYDRTAGMGGPSRTKQCTGAAVSRCRLSNRSTCRPVIVGVTPKKIMSFRIRTLFATWALWLSTTGGIAQEVRITPPEAKYQPAAKVLPEELFADGPKVDLMSHNGIWGGQDNDTEITLRRDGTLLITTYSYSVSYAPGKYKLVDNGTIVITPTEGKLWLPMPWSIEDGKLVIGSPDKKLLFEAARKAGIPESELTEEAYKEACEQWPFRQVDRKKIGVTKR